MALQPCRSGLARARHILRSSTTSSLRACYSSDASPYPTAPAQSSSYDPDTPRWSQTPEGMRAPVQMDFAKNPKNKIWVCNEDPQQLDVMYQRLLGSGGHKMLPDEVKWLAVTHKSFDQGRRGFNDRLALLGRSILAMEATKHIVSSPPAKPTFVKDALSDRRQPFQHSQLQPVDNLNVRGPKDIAGKEQLFALGQRIGLLKVLRWKPRLPENLASSGVDTVMNGAILAIIGAITLQHGAAVASKVVRERILPKGGQATAN